MKRRLVKKWIKRYLHPLIKDLPRAQSYQLIEDERLGADGYMRRYVYSSVAIANGHAMREGERYPNGNGLRRDIIRTRNTLERMMEKSRKTFLRVYPEYSIGILYMRVLIEKDTI